MNGLGAVSVDIHKQGREFENLTLSDDNVVKYLILYRSKRDVTYGANTNININEAGDMFEFNQELICLYASLDKTIDKVGFNEKEAKFIKLLFEGNTITDVINIHKLYPKKTAYRTWKRIVEDIVKENLKEWKKVLDNAILKDR